MDNLDKHLETFKKRDAWLLQIIDGVAQEITRKYINEALDIRYHDDWAEIIGNITLILEENDVTVFIREQVVENWRSPNVNDCIEQIMEIVDEQY